MLVVTKSSEPSIGIGSSIVAYDAFGQSAQRLHVGISARQDDELVAAHARDDIVGANRAFEAFADDAQQPVAAVVTERIVDVLEAVEIEKEHADRRFGPPRLFEQHAQAIDEPCPIRQGSHRVAVGERLQPRARAAAFDRRR